MSQSHLHAKVSVIQCFTQEHSRNIQEVTKQRKEKRMAAQHDINHPYSQVEQLLQGLPKFSGILVEQLWVK